MAPTDIMLDCASIPVGLRLRRWRELVGDHLAGVEMRRPCHVPMEQGFNGTMALRAHNVATFAHVRSANQLLSRTPGNIREAVQETALITFVVSGECHIAQEGRAAVLKAGDLCLYESMRPYEIATPGAFEALVIMADRQLAEQTLGELRALTAIPITRASPLGAFAASYWREFYSRAAELNDAAISKLLFNGFDILGAALVADPTVTRANVCLQRAKIFLAQNFHQPDLSIAEAAAAAGLSVRRLQELFQAEGITFSGHLRALRLNAAARNLTAPSAKGWSLAAVMHDAGFVDQPQFSRAFRKAFGMSPRAYRNSRREGQAFWSPGESTRRARSFASSCSDSGVAGLSSPLRRLTSAAPAPSARTTKGETHNKSVSHSNGGLSRMKLP